MKQPMGDEELARAASAALREGVRSSAAARDRIMHAVRGEPRPVRGRGPAPWGAASRPLWRSPALMMLAAASIATFVVLVHARRVEGPIARVPGQAPPIQPVQARDVAATPTLHAPAVTPGAAAIARVQFVFVAPTAHRVSVVGDFNDWDPAATPLAASGGVWSRELDVAVGRHDYAFVIDGARWVADPAAPRAPADEFGGERSVLMVGGDR